MSDSPDNLAPKLDMILAQLGDLTSRLSDIERRMKYHDEQRVILGQQVDNHAKATAAACQAANELQDRFQKFVDDLKTPVPSAAPKK